MNRVVVILKLLRSPEIDSKESIPQAYVAWRAGTRTLFLLGSWPPIDCSKIPAQATQPGGIGSLESLLRLL
jgi:hypothetical protein